MDDQLKSLLTFDIDKDDSLTKELQNFTSGFTFIPDSGRITLVNSWEPTPVNIDRIFDLAKCLVEEDTIARVAMCVPFALYLELKVQYPIIQETIDSARSLTEAMAASALMQSVYDPTSKSRLTSAQYVLKHKFKWSETLEIAPKTTQQPHDNLKTLTNEDLTRLLELPTMEPVAQPASVEVQDNEVVSTSELEDSVTPFQEPIPIRDDDTLETLAARAFSPEHLAEFPGDSDEEIELGPDLEDYVDEEELKVIKEEVADLLVDGKLPPESEPVKDTRIIVTKLFPRNQ